MLECKNLNERLVDGTELYKEFGINRILVYCARRTFIPYLREKYFLNEM